MQTTEQKKAFKKALILGSWKEFAIAKGGTGELRGGLTRKEYDKRKKRKQTVKASRKANRK